MPNVLEWIFVVLFAVAWPLYEHFLGWPRFQRRLRERPERARQEQYGIAILQQWLLVAVGVALWTGSSRPWSALGLAAPQGWRLWVSIVLVMGIAALYARNVASVVGSVPLRRSLRAKLTGVEPVLPHTSKELDAFLPLSLTAGFCEEFLFRGFFLWALTPWTTWWGAVALSALVFGFGHSYQGRGGAVRSGLVGVGMSLLYGLTGSLLPSVALHALVDIGSGLIGWIVLQPEAAMSEPTQLHEGTVSAIA